MRFLKRSIRTTSEWDRACKAYMAHYASIKDKLPASAQAVHDNSGGFHDSSVREVLRFPDRLVLVLDPGIQSGNLRLILWGSRILEAPSELVGAEWEYDEWDLAPGDRFELRVRFNEGDLRVEASRVGLYDLDRDRWIVDPDTPDPTALEGPRKRSRRRK